MAANHLTLIEVLDRDQQWQVEDSILAAWQTFISNTNMEGDRLLVDFESWRRSKPQVIYFPDTNGLFGSPTRFRFLCRKIVQDFTVEEIQQASSYSPVWLLTRLFFCCRHGHIEMLKQCLPLDREESILLRSGQIEDLKTALFIEAVALGQLHIVQHLYESRREGVREISVCIENRSWTLRDLAEGCGHLEIVAFLNSQRLRSLPRFLSTLDLSIA